MARVKIQLADNIKRVVTVDTEATQGARLGRDVYLPSGQVATPTTFLQWLGTTPSAGGGSSSGGSGPSLASILTTKGDLATRDSQPQRLGIGAQGTALRVSAGGLPEWRAGAALTKTDDTNVTLTLGGTPATSLLAAASITAGWTGQLAVPRGGTGFGSYTAGDLLYASSGSALSKLGVGSAGDVMRVSGGAPAWQATSTMAANPSAQVGLAAVNGSAGTFMRSDAAPALDQGIAPTWTGVHTWQRSGPQLNLINTAGGANAKWWVDYISSNERRFTIYDDTPANERQWLNVTRSGNAVASMVYGNPTDNPTHTFYGYTTALTAGTQVLLGNAGLYNVFDQTSFIVRDFGTSNVLLAISVGSINIGNSTDNPAISVNGQTVSYGAADSGGTGFRVLRVPN